MADFTQEVVDGLVEISEGTKYTEHDRVRYLREFEDAGRAGQWSDDDFDFDYMFESWCGKNGDALDGKHFLKDSGIRFDANELQERISGAMSSTKFTDLYQTILSVGQINRLDNIELQLLPRIDRTIRLDQQTRKLFGLHPLGDLMTPAEELEETQFYGLAGRSVTMPNPSKEKFALAVTREMLSLGANDLIRQRMNEGLDSANLHAEKLVTDMVYEIFPSGVNPWPYIEDDVAYDTYQAGPTPWANLLTSNAPDGTFAPFQAVYTAWEALRDDYTGEIVNNRVNDIIVTADEPGRLLQDGLGQKMIERDTVMDGSATERTRTTRPADGNFRLIAKSDYGRDRLTKWYQTTAGGSLSAGAALTAAKDTWLIGDLNAAFGFGTEWEFEKIERSGNQNWEYFNQEIVLAVKYLWKVTPVVKNPRRILQNR